MRKTFFRIKGGLTSNNLYSEIILFWLAHILARSTCRTTVAEGEIEIVQINLFILIMENDA